MTTLSRFPGIGVFQLVPSESERGCLDSVVGATASGIAKLGGREHFYLVGKAATAVIVITSLYQ